MNFFYLLLLAHVVGDFPLQNDAIFRLKQKSMMGVVVHVAVFAAVALIILTPFLAQPVVWAAVLLLSVAHLLLDRLKVKMTRRPVGDRFRFFLADQALHIFFIGLAAYWLSQTVTDAAMPGLYANRRRLISANALIVAGFAGSVLMFYAERLVIHILGGQRIAAFPNQRQRWPGVLIRTIAAAGAIAGDWYTLLLLIVPLHVHLHPCWFHRLKPLWLHESLAHLLICMACAAWVWLGA